MTVINITDQNYNETLHNHKVVLIDFWQPYCPPCKVMEPILDELDNEMGNSIKIGKLNSVDHPKTPSLLGIMSTPTLVLFKNGNLVEKIVGFRSKQELTSIVHRFLHNE